MDNEVINNIRQIVREEIKTGISPLKKDIVILKDDVSGLKDDVSGLKKDVSGLKDDVSGLKKDVSGLKDDVSGLKQQMSSLENKVDINTETINHIKIRQDHIFEQTGILNEFRTEVNDKLDKIDDDYEFKKFREHDIEQEIYFLKKEIRKIKREQREQRAQRAQ